MYLLLILSYKCTYDHDNDKDLRRSRPRRFTIYEIWNLKFNFNNRKPIRIFFNTSSFLDKKMVCLKVGDIIDGVKCTEDDIMDDKKLNVIQSTLNEIKTFFSQIIRVTPYEGCLDNINNADLLIYVYVKPFGNSKILARAGHTEKNPDIYDLSRPIKGKMAINPSKIPLKPEGFNTDNRQFFSVLAHEMMHILAFSKDLFNFWRDRNGEPYKNIIKEIKRIDGVSQKFLNTAKLTEWVNDRFNVYDENLINLGLELEDGGGEGTESSHPNSRLFFTDVMQGTAHEVQYFSPVFFNSLYDSGWYDVNFSLQESLVFLDPELNNGFPNQDILVKPPIDTYPKDYFCENNGDFACFYDYSAKAMCSIKSEEEIRTIDPSYPKNTSWVNPYNFENVGSDELLDYSPLYLPTSSCRTLSEFDQIGINMLEEFGVSSVCAMSTLVKFRLSQLFQAFPACYKARCKAGGKLYLVLEDGEHFCSRANKKIYVKGRSGFVICPPPSIACLNHKIESTISIIRAIPDRGPRDGGNYISFIGENLTNLKIKEMKLGEIDLLEQGYKIINNRIITKLSQNLNINNSFINIPQKLYITADGYDDSIIESIYTFTEHLYNQDIIPTPCFFLILIVILLTFINEIMDF